MQQWLDGAKETYNGLGDLLASPLVFVSLNLASKLISQKRKVAKNIKSTVPQFVAMELDVVYFPQIGYLITIPSRIKRSALREEEFQFQFTANDTNYFKNRPTRELDEKLGDIHGLIVDREIEIIQQLLHDLSQYEKMLINISAACAALDCILSLSVVAEKFNYIRPKMTTDNCIMVRAGRHPIEELVIDAFIHNDTYISCSHPHYSETQSRYFSQADVTSNTNNGEDNTVVLLSGPNHSGKSVYLKQVRAIIPK
ncbi:hypothetical protein NQZ79_g1389 [Umbelopsis isabellina]|nr:hypothetical protein NQZ79_g1389 [Umbelopsis isabellina]